MPPDPAFAPYAPKKAVMTVITRYRERGLPDPLTGSALEQIGVAGTMTPRTLQALRFLGLIDEGGNRLEPFERLKRATTEEYAAQLAEIVRAAYLPVFTIVNPAEDSDIAISDAFRQYEPGAQREKMIALFRGLCEDAGIIPARKRPPASSTKPRQEAQSRRATPQATKERPKEQQKPQGREGAGGDGSAIDYQVIAAIIQQLPRDARWTPARRERWLRAMTAAIDLLIEVNGDTGVELPDGVATRHEAMAEGGHH